MVLQTGGLQLKIANTTINDTGTFTCTAVNPAGKDSVDMELEVMGRKTCVVNYRNESRSSSQRLESIKYAIFIIKCMFHKYIYLHLEPPRWQVRNE